MLNTSTPPRKWWLKMVSATDRGTGSHPESNKHSHSDTCGRILNLLTDNPSGNEVARAIALDFLLKFNVTKVRITGVRSDDSLLFLADYGFDPSTTGKSEPAAVWRTRNDEIRHMELDSSHFGFNPEHTCAAAQLKIRGVTVGVLAIYFATPLNPQLSDELASVIADLVGPISLYFFMRPHSPSVHTAGTTRHHEASPSHFTERQLKILKRMSDGFTNHEIASALGFSVSTIRHETMRIFQILSASDRHEAASKALELGILQRI